jgi:N-acetylmuramoyl-L-alanine amidase
MRNINLIVLHHSASDYKDHDDIKVIKKWHVEERGFSDVGYHYFIRKDGLIQTGRPLATVGAHCKGKNRKSIGICLSGNTKFTEHQFTALAHLLWVIELKIGKKVGIRGHCDFSKKDCPVFDVDEFKANANIHI